MNNTEKSPEELDSFVRQTLDGLRHHYRRNGLFACFFGLALFMLWVYFIKKNMVASGNGALFTMLLCCVVGGYFTYKDGDVAELDYLFSEHGAIVFAKEQYQTRLLAYKFKLDKLKGRIPKRESPSRNG